MTARLLPALLLLSSAARADIVRGRILEDHTGTPVASVEVRIAKLGQRELVADLETDAQGRFAGPELTPGDYRIDLSKPNFASATLRLHAPAPGGLQPLAVRLVRLAVISGRVIDADGKPVRGAGVMIIPRPPDGAPPRPQRASTQVPMARVDPAGNYRLFGLPPGEYLIAVSYGASTSSAGSSGNFEPAVRVGSGAQFYPDNERPRWFTISGGEQIQNIDFLVRPSALYHLSGTVPLPDSKANAWLALIPVEQPALAMAIAETKREGVFQFEGIPPGNYYLTAAGPTHARGSLGAIPEPDPFFGRIRVNVAAANVEGLTVPVDKGRSFSLILRSTGAGCPSATSATLSAAEDWGFMFDRTIEVSAAKPLIVSDLAPARYIVSATKLGETCYQASPVVVDLSGAAPSEPVAVNVAAAGSIRGRLTGARTPAGYTVTLVSSGDADDEPRLLMALPDPDGNFNFAGLRPGKYAIAAQPAGEAPQSRWLPDLSRMFQVDVPGGHPLDMELPVPAPAAGGNQ